MNAAELAQLTPEQKRVRIAEACGWHSIKTCSCKCQPHGLAAGVAGDRNYKHLPDYLSDLNAIHAAVKTLLPNPEEREFGQGRWITYIDHLCKICGFDSNERVCFAFSVVNAGAAQCADAFLLTVSP